MRIFPCNVFMGVRLSNLRISFSSRFWIVWILFVSVSEQLPYTSILNFVSVYKYIVHLTCNFCYFIFNLIDYKYFKSDSRNLSTCSFQFKVFSRVTPWYWNVSTLCISIYSSLYIRKITWSQFFYCMKQNKIRFVRVHNLHHFHNSHNLSFIVSTSVCRSEWFINNIDSSAKSDIFWADCAIHIINVW